MLTEFGVSLTIISPFYKLSSHAVSHVGEASMAIKKGQAVCARRARPVLGYQQFGGPSVGRLWVVQLVPVKEHHHVGVLFEAVVYDYAVGDEVVRSADGGVVDMSLSVRLQGNDCIPPDVREFSVEDRPHMPLTPAGQYQW